MKWIFLYACIAMSCPAGVALPGDDVNYPSKPACERAAQRHSSRWHVSSHSYEIACVERDQPIAPAPR